ncbi:hypothetical protein ONZ45_g4387 [Pleurotus djamor]|nr:hypothetical protein ONZ45_g4387 [Pleurotus djamor]
MRLPRNLLTACAWSLSASLVHHVGGIAVYPRAEEENGSALVNVNITLDNSLMQDSPASTSSLAGLVSINLTGTWTASPPADQAYAYGGSYLWTSDPTAKAELKFNGTSIYYMSPRFDTVPSLTFMSEIQVDNYPRVLVNLGSTNSSPSMSVTGIHPNTASTIMWSRSGLNFSREHTLTLTMAQGAQYAILDTFIYTAFLAPGDPRLPSASADGSSSSTTQPSPSSSSNSSSSPLSKSVRITLITLASVLLALLVYVAYRFIQARGKRGDRNRDAADGVRRWVDMRWVNASRTNLPGRVTDVGAVAGAGTRDDHPGDIKVFKEVKSMQH